MNVSQQDLSHLSRIKRLNIINAVSGVKPANLIGTISDDGKPNLAIFSSVVHLGSDPALIGLVFRPQHENPKSTYLNIQCSGHYTINHVPLSLVERAHFTSARFPMGISEFEKCGFTEEYLFGCPAPFVKESLLKMSVEKVDEIPIPANQTLLMVGQITHLQFPDEMMDDDGNLNLETIDTAGIGGVNTYYKLKKEALFPYAHVKDVPDFSSNS